MSASKHPPDSETGCLVDAEQLRWTCAPSRFAFGDTSEIGECPIEIIGQPRALAALSLGLEVRSDGYNIFVVGEVGTGRSTTVRRTIARMSADETTPPDLLFVHNFADPDRPKLLAFPAGQGRRFRNAMDEVIRNLRTLLPRLFESETYRERRARLIEEAKAEHRARLKEFEERATAAGFALAQIQMGEMVRPEIVAVIDDKPVAVDDLEDSVESGEFDRDRFRKLKEEHGRLAVELGSTTKEVRAIQRRLRRQLEQLDRQLAEQQVRDAVEDLRDEFDQVEVADFLDAAIDDVLDRLPLFRRIAEFESGDEDGSSESEIESALTPYRVNLLVDNNNAKGRPILWEASPSFRNLFGTVERVPSPQGVTETDHTRIKAGSLVRANGGFLVVDALDLLVEQGVWPALKRTLRTHELEIQSYDPRHPQLGSALQPEPIPLDIKVIMIGTPQIYRTLYALDEDFAKIFKVKADFALRTERSDEELVNYACFVLKKVGDDDLPHFTAAAVAGIVEYGVRLAGRQDKLTTQFNRIADLIRESGYWARSAQAALVDVAHVDRAVREQKYRRDLIEEVLRERIREGSVLVDLTGARVGQINGLVILDVGDHRFGQPSRITATTAMGRVGIVDIERESEMSGPIHAKGVLILAGFLRNRFAQDRPLTLSASLCFEQSYAMVEGDSASCAELFALLSALSDTPLRQSIAITGSVDQTGRVQPIGGINEKIEGFFDLCVERGLDGSHGVIVPRRNLDDLMLRKDVVEAVARGRFRVWAIDDVEEGIEILTGEAAGSRTRGGDYPPDSVFGKVDRRLASLAEGVKEYGPADR